MIKRLLIFVFIILVLSLISLYFPSFQKSEIESREAVVVVRVIDGDTLKTENQTIRLLGINTPEKGQPYYGEAKGFLQEFENQTIEILKDNEDVDRYDRKLRYVFYDDGIINVEILEQGFGTSFMVDGLKYENKLLVAEDQARTNNLGLWKESVGICSRCINLLELNAEEEFFVIKNICDFDCELDGWTVKDNANHFFKLNDLEGGQVEKYLSKGKIWNNAGDRFFMRDGVGGLVIFYAY